MAEIIAFDGHRRRVCSARAAPQTAENRKPNQHDVSRVVANYYAGRSVTAIARQERVGLNHVEAIIRENSRPVMPLARRQMDRRLIARAA
jgi:hypothetical protein